MAHLLPSEPIETYADYLERGPGGAGIARAVEIGPEATLEEVRASGLRGRGGAGFPTGRKWAGVLSQEGDRRYVVVNGAEGEPGTFKDRALLRANPYQLVEGAIIAAYALGADEVYFALKSRFEQEADRLLSAISEMQVAGVCRDCTMSVARGPDDYLFGEETAMLEVIEGGDALPRLLPPYQHGLFGKPTLVNNVETLSNVTHILANGAGWFRSSGTVESPGTTVVTVVGDVERATVVEVDLGTPLREVLDAAGLRRPVQAVFSGVSNRVVKGEAIDVPLSYEGFASIESGMGAAGFIVVDDSRCMVDVACVISGFLAVESCGQCPPCKVGSSEITTRLRALRDGTATSQDVTEIGSWSNSVTDANRCYLGTEEQNVVRSVLGAFPDDVVAHIEQGGCGRSFGFELPKLADIVDGRSVLVK